MERISFYFTYNGTTLELPVNPQEINVSYQGNNRTTEVVALGDINVLKDRQLAVISFDSWFPEDTWYPGIQSSSIYSARYYKNFFLGIMEDKKPVRLVITGINVSMLVSIETFEYKHQSGDHEDMYYTITVKEYRPYTVTQISIDPNLGSTPTPVPPKENPSTGGTPQEITIGADVIVTGRLYGNSLGEAPGQSLSNYRGKINFIQKTNWPYHVTTPQGGWLGWVTAGSVRLA